MSVDVLIVDDSSAIRKILQRILRHTGLPVGMMHEAADGHEALAAMRSQSVGLVLADLNMPNMDGIELLRQLKSHVEWRAVPVVVVSCEGEPGRVLEALECGAAGYVRKPFTAEQIRTKLAPFFLMTQPLIP